MGSYRHTGAGPRRLPKRLGHRVLQPGDTFDDDRVDWSQTADFETVTAAKPTVVVSAPAPAPSPSLPSWESVKGRGWHGARRFLRELGVTGTSWADLEAGYLDLTEG